MSTDIELASNGRMNVNAVNAMEQQLRQKLEASGEFGKMRAMIVDAALKALNNNNNNNNNNNTKTDNTIASTRNVKDKNNREDEHENVKQTNSVNRSASSPFAPSHTLQQVKQSQVGKVVFSLIFEMLERCHLPYTASVLRMEANLTDYEIRSKENRHYDELLSSFANLTSNDLPLLCSLIKHISEVERIKYEVNEDGHNKIEEKKEEKEKEEYLEEQEEREERNLQEPAEQNKASEVKEIMEAISKSEEEVEKPSAQQAGDAVDSTYFISKWHDKTFFRQNAITGQQLQVEYLCKCTLYVLDAIDSITIDDCEDCELVIAACEGSVFIRNCTRLTVHVACKQLRLRDCRECDLHVFTSTDPVIEMSHHITFHPFHLRLPDLTAKFAAAHLDALHNRFVNVYDFTEDETSLAEPHFTVLYPFPSVHLEDRCVERGTVDCPEGIQQLLTGAIEPAASSESGKNKSYNIKKGASVWQHVSSPTSEGNSTKPTDLANIPQTNKANIAVANDKGKGIEYGSLLNTTTNSYELSDDDDNNNDDGANKNNNVNRIGGASNILNNKIINTIKKHEKEEENDRNSDISFDNDDDNDDSSDKASSKIKEDKSTSSSSSSESKEYEDSDDEEDDDESDETFYTDSEDAEHSENTGDSDDDDDNNNNNKAGSTNSKHKDAHAHTTLDNNENTNKMSRNNLPLESNTSNEDNAEEQSVASPIREVPSLHKTNISHHLANLNTALLDKGGKPPVASAGNNTAHELSTMGSMVGSDRHTNVHHHTIGKGNNNDSESYSSFEDDDNDDDDDAKDDHYNVDEDDDVF